MKKTYPILIVVLIVLVVAVYLYFSMNKAPIYQNTTNTPSSSQQTGPTQGIQANNVITIKGYAFNPSVLTVKAGTTVTWINNDSANHNIKSSAFTSPSMATGEKFEFQFNTKGTYNYNCGIHPTMTGQIVVE